MEDGVGESLEWYRSLVLLVISYPTSGVDTASSRLTKTLDTQPVVKFIRPSSPRHASSVKVDYGFFLFSSFFFNSDNIIVDLVG